MTISEAREHVDREVAYRPFADVLPERGVITSVDEHWVHVRYGSNSYSEKTEPWLLTLLRDSHA
jgi:hypothetical protein